MINTTMKTKAGYYSYAESNRLCFHRMNLSPLPHAREHQLVLLAQHKLNVNYS